MTASKTSDFGDSVPIDDEQMETLQSVEPEVDPLVGTTIADRYRVDEKLGEGGMGAVYKGEHVLMQKAVAIKVLHREMTAMGEVVKRFEREAIAAGRIDHPNVATATDFGKLPDGAFFLVLEYVPGQSLTDVLRDAGGPLEESRALIIARQVASALAAAHAAGIVHRDLKPDNVMLISKAGTGDFVKVLDFGIAKVDATGGNQLTRIGSVFGTPQYMSPEQAQGKTVDRRADLYALGLVLYEMLAGRPTFESEEMVGLLTAQMTETPAPLPPGVQPEVSAIVMRLLEKDPDARYQDAAELVEALDELVGPLPAPPESGLMPSMRGTMRSAMSSVVREDAGTAEVSHRPSQLVETARTSVVAAARTATEVLQRTVPVKGRRVPVWAVAGAFAAVGAVGVLAFGGDDTEDVGTALAEQVEDSDDDDPGSSDALLAMVEIGKRDAMQQVLEIDEDERTADQWRALARGHERHRETTEAIEAYRAAVRANPKLRTDKHMLQFVRNAAEKDESRELALGFAADELGERGADLLFEVWSATSAKTPATIAAKQLLDTSKVRESMSPALRVAMELRDARSCAEYKRLLPAAESNGDERSYRPLQKLTRDRGCGFLDMGDCYSCLRGGTALRDALTAVQTRNAPRF